MANDINREAYRLSGNRKLMDRYLAQVLEGCGKSLSRDIALCLSLLARSQSGAIQQTAC